MCMGWAHFMAIRVPYLMKRKEMHRSVNFFLIPPLMRQVTKNIIYEKVGGI